MPCPPAPRRSYCLHSCPQTSWSDVPSVLRLFQGALALTGVSETTKTPNDTNCQTSLLPGPSPTPQSRHLRSPGAQLHHSIITAFRSAASVGRLGNLNPKIRWREPPGGLELSAQPKLSPSPRARRPHHFFPRFNIPPRSRHLRSPGAQLHHSIITAFRPTALVSRLGNLTTTITMARASWRT